jgi:hypothetical protein
MVYNRGVHDWMPELQKILMPLSSMSNLRAIRKILKQFSNMLSLSKMKKANEDFQCKTISGQYYPSI